MNGEARLPAGSGPRAAEEEKKMQPSLEHAARLLLSEIQWVKEGEGKKEVETYRDIVSNRNIKLTEKVLIPIKQHPKFNFVGKLLGPQGNSLKRLQAETGTKMSILGKGCMRDKAKEEELRRGGEGKYFHLREELHVLIEVFAPPGEAYARMGHALKEVKKFLVPDYNDEIRQEQLRELTFLNGSSEHTHCLGRGRARGRPIHNLPPPHATTPVGRARGGTFIGPAGLLRHLPLKTRCIPLPRMVLGTHVPSISGPRAPPQHHVPPPTPNSFSDYLYCDGYPGAVEQLSYDVMNNSYCAVPQSAASIYDFELEDSEATTFEPFIQWEAHNTSYIEPWPAPPRQLKAPASRGSKGSFRDHPYGQF